MAAIATTPTPTPQTHGVFAAPRRTCDASFDGGTGEWPDMTIVGALLMPEGAPIVVSDITTVAAPAADVVVTPLAVGMPCRDAESRRRRLRSAPISAAV